MRENIIFLKLSDFQKHSDAKRKVSQESKNNDWVQNLEIAQNNNLGKYDNVLFDTQRSAINVVAREETSRFSNKIVGQASHLHFTGKPRDGCIYKKGSFQGACICKGAAWSVCSAEQARAYGDQSNLKFNLRTSSTFFVSCNQTHLSMGMLGVRIPIYDDALLPIKADIVAADNPLQIKLNGLK